MRRATAVVVLAALALTLTTQDAMAQGATLGRPSLSGLRGFVTSLMAGDPRWGGVPSQRAGTAAGRRHQVPAAATRAGRGVGHPQGRGKGELPAYTPYKSRRAAGRSTSLHGFNARTSKRVDGKSTAHSTYYRNADGSFSRKVSQSPLNFKDAKGEWRQIDTSVAQRTDHRWVEKSNAVDVGFAPRAADEDLASFGKDGKSVGFALEG
ncbi:hypothetical protein, partial [Streptomyces sp. NPDC085596]|uniref:hypothetical protein n=1 Tax=Streptomyces sp. NPDC085596 TaxID=3365731 RepID=UPI0037D6459A